MFNFYLYSVTSVSLVTLYVATLVLVKGLLRLALGVEPDYASREAVANGLGFLVIALPLWVIHWRWLRQQFVRAQGGAVTAHRFYLFTVVCLNAMAIMVGGSLGATALANAILGVSSGGADVWVRTGVAFTAMGLSLFLWLHHWRPLVAVLGEKEWGSQGVAKALPRT